MMGCRHGAKNTLDLNYLYLAEKRGAKIFRRDQGCRCPSAERSIRWQQWIRGSHRQLVAAFQSPSSPLYLPRRSVLSIVAGHDGIALRSEGQRLAAGNQRSARPLRAHQLRVAHWRARAALPGRSIEGRGHRLRRLHRRAHAHRGGALSRRLEHHGYAGDDPDRRTPRPGACSALAEEPLRVAPAPSLKQPAGLASAFAGRASASSCSACRRWKAIST